MKNILDHGYLDLVETYGSDERIVEAARMSTGKGFLGWDPGPCPVCAGEGSLTIPLTGPGIDVKCQACEGKGKVRGDAKLLRYLYENKHSTPFEMAGMIIEVQAPIFVFREWYRHRTQSYNEMSARYIPLPNLNYVPTIERLLLNSKKNKQAGTAKGARQLTEEEAVMYRDRLFREYRADQDFYEHALSIGVPKELARAHLPVGRYSRMRAHANLRNWLLFLTLRADSKAQWEIQQYAWGVHELLSAHFPRTMELFDEARAA